MAGIQLGYSESKTDASSAGVGDFRGSSFVVNEDTLDIKKIIIVAVLLLFLVLRR